MTTQIKNTVNETVKEQGQEEHLQMLKDMAAKNKIKMYQKTSSGRGGFISMVKATNGTCLKISKQVNEQLGYPMELFIGIEGDYLLIFNSEGLDVGNIIFDKNDKERLNIYNKSLVDSIIATFNLDYTDRTSRSFADGHFKEQGRPVLYVKMV